MLGRKEHKDHKLVRGYLRFQPLASVLQAQAGSSPRSDRVLARLSPGTQRLRCSQGVTPSEARLRPGELKRIVTPEFQAMFPPRASLIDSLRQTAPIWVRMKS